MLGLSPPHILHLSKCLILSRADSHGSSVGPVNHVLRAIRGHMPPSHSRSQSPTRLRSHISRVTLAERGSNSANSHPRRSSKSLILLAEPFAIRRLRDPTRE